MNSHGLVVSLMHLMRRSCSGWRRLLIAGWLICLLWASAVADAADIALSETCSLANAIRSANGDTQVSPADQCAAGDATENDKIIFVADVEITEALPAIASDMWIMGENHSLSTPADTESETPPTYDFNLLTINKGNVEIIDLFMSGADDSAIKAVEAENSELDLIITDCVISDNTAATNGGAVHIGGGAEVQLYRNLIRENAAPEGNGGAIYIKNSTVLVQWNFFRSNSTKGNGGAIYFENDSSDEYKLSVVGNSFRGDKATDDDDSTSTAENGGAIYITNAATNAGAVSGIKNNSFSGHSARNGGAIYHASGSLTVDNNTIDEGAVSGKGGGIYAAGGTVDIRHSTIIKNQAANGGNIAIFSDDDEQTEDPTVNLYNSIVVDNTDTDSSDTTCFRDALNENVGNIIRDSNCAAAQAAEADLLLKPVDAASGNLPRSLATRYYQLLPGSPAIDSGDDGAGRMLSTDQLGRSRPRGFGYDIGAYEFMVAPPSSESEEDPSDSDAETAKIRHTCGPLSEADNGITIEATFGLESGVQCQEIGADGIGILWIIDAGFIKAVDIWSYVEQGVQVCFDASGPLLFLDATTIPKTVMSISSFVLDGKTCASINRPGSIVVQSSASGAGLAPVATVAAPAVPDSASPSLTNCTVTTTDVLNFRDAPLGNRIGWIPQDVTLTVLESANGWLKVNYARDGWISADYVAPQGDCA